MSITSVSEKIRLICEICVREKKKKRIYPIYLNEVSGKSQASQDALKEFTEFNLLLIYFPSKICFPYDVKHVLIRISL